MTIETSYGFRSAQAAWENATPYDGECICPPLFHCPECEEVLAEGETCDEKCEVPVEEIPREDATVGAEQSCPQHGWCGGCSSRNCEDCNG